jgi:hypothetical protein
MDENEERMKARMAARMEAKIDAKHAQMISTVCVIRSELEETIQHEMKYFLSYVDQRRRTDAGN